MNSKVEANGTIDPLMHSGSLKFLLVLPFLLAACSSGSDGSSADDAPVFSEVVVIGESDFTPIIANSEIAVGPNRLAFGIVDAEGLLVVDAKVTLTFYDLNDGQEVKILEIEAVSRVPARDAGIEEVIQHTHADGSGHVHVNASEQIGVYTANVTFDRAGIFGVVIEVEIDDPKASASLQSRFNVLEVGVTPAIGSSAPLTRNLTVADVDDLAVIDSSAEPSPDMHRTTIADAIASGKPTLVLFAAPGYCVSQLCGPEFEIMRKLFLEYGDRAEFIHVEFFKDPGTPEQTPVDAVAEWNLQSEPWFFLIDSEGLIVAKFEGPTSLKELQEVLEEITS